MGLNIVDARIIQTLDGHSLDTYTVLEENNKELSDKNRIIEIEKELSCILAGPDGYSLTVTRRANRQVRLFTTNTQLNFSEDTINNRTIMELIAGDRPGLLSRIGRTLLQANVFVHDAKIVTVGERAEYVFYLTDQQGKPLNQLTKDQLRDQLISELDQKSAA